LQKYLIFIFFYSIYFEELAEYLKTDVAFWRNERTKFGYFKLGEISAEEVDENA